MTLKSNLASYVCTIQHFEKPAQLKFVSQPVPCYHSLTQKVKVLSSPRHEITKRKVFFLKVKEPFRQVFTWDAGTTMLKLKFIPRVLNQLTFLWRLCEFMEIYWYFISGNFHEIWTVGSSSSMVLWKTPTEEDNLRLHQTTVKLSELLNFPETFTIGACTCLVWNSETPPQTRVILLLLMRPVWHMVSWQAQWCCNIL